MYALCQFFRSKSPKNQHFWCMHFSKVAACKFAYTPFLDQVGSPLVFFCRKYGFILDFMLYYYCSKWSIGLKSIRYKHILIIVKIWDAKTCWHTIFIDCEDIQENTATFNLNTKVLRQGKTKLSQKQIKRIAFILATDLKNFAESKGDFSNLSANEVYSHLQNNQ